MTDKTLGIDREYYINHLATFFTSKSKEYYEKLSDRELIVEYERLMKLD